jgi:hypothetical protein
MDENRLRKLAGLNEAQITGSQLLSHVISVMKKLKFTIISADKVDGGVVVVRTRASDFALDAKMSSILGKDKFFVAVTMSAREAIFRFEADLNENLNEVRAGQDPAVSKAIANDLVDVFKISKGNKTKIRDAAAAVLQGFNARERSTSFSFVANLADKLDDFENTREGIERVDEGTGKQFLSQLETLVKDASRDKRAMEKAIEEAETEDRRGFKTAQEFLDLVDTVWDQDFSG